LIIPPRFHKLNFLQRCLLGGVVFIAFGWCHPPFLAVASNENQVSSKVPDEAREIYQRHQSHVFQVQVVDRATGKKSAIGSGFLIDARYLATNFHVVAAAVHKPNAYRVEVVREDDTSGALTIEAIDVIHDLAIVKTDRAAPTYARLGRFDLAKGEKIFAMGNPHDLGMTIVEGTYNGLMKNSLYKKILFSGSLNPGMSGGPTFNHDGEVIGVNVATAGNQLSFLVPVSSLKRLWNDLRAGKIRRPAKGWEPVIERQLLQNQDRYMRRLLSSDWETLSIGEGRVPGEISGIFKCWGDSVDQKEKLYKYSYMDCSTDDALFLSDSFQTGRIHYRYNWMRSKGLMPWRFYRAYQTYYSYPLEFTNASKQDVSNFECRSDFVVVGGKDWKVALCARNYKKYPRLYDVDLSMASVHATDRGLLVDVVALGVTQANAVKFMEKFLKAIQWKK